MTETGVENLIREYMVRWGVLKGVEEEKNKSLESAKRERRTVNK